MTEQKLDRLRRIWEQIDGSESLNESRRKAALEQAIEELRSLVNTGYDPAWYPLGYAYYSHPDRGCESSIAAETVASLEKAASLGIEADLSYLYLAYHAFDTEDYDSASLYVQRVQALDESLRPRLWELALCVRLKQAGIADSVGQISEFASKIEGEPQWDIPPLLLINTLESCISTQGRSREIDQALERLDLAYPVLSGDYFQKLGLED